MNAISTYIFHEFHNIRIIDLNGELWFVATDVASALDYRNAPDMTRSLDEDETATHNLRIRSGNGVEQDRPMTIINESGLYSAILKSRKPEAKIFKKWVTSEVLPSIRKTGGYHTAQTPPIRSEKPQYLDHKDMQNIRDLVWQCSRVFGNNDAVTRAVWHAIRQVTGVPCPDKFQTQHLKPMAEEFLRILGIVESYTDLRRQTERDIIKQIIRERGDGYQMQQIFMDLEDFSAKHNGELRKAIPLMFKQKCQRLIDRQ